MPFFPGEESPEELVGFWVPPPPLPLSFHPQELSWDPREGL